MSVSTVTVTTFRPMQAAAVVLQIIVFLGQIYDASNLFSARKTNRISNIYVFRNAMSDFKKNYGLDFVKKIIVIL